LRDFERLKVEQNKAYQTCQMWQFVEYLTDDDGDDDDDDDDNNNNNNNNKCVRQQNITLLIIVFKYLYFVILY